MQLITCKDQARCPFDQYYDKSKDSSNLLVRLEVKAMIDLVASLRALPDDREIYVLTSHFRLCLLPKDTGAPPWPVIISALCDHEYYVNYRLPENFAPWRAAEVTGTAHSAEEAARWAIIAMEKSGAWNGNGET